MKKIKEQIRSILEGLVNPEAPLAPDECEANLDGAVEELYQILKSRGGEKKWKKKQQE